MATQPGAPPPDVDQPDVTPTETPVPNEPGQPGSPESPDEFPSESPAYDEPDTGPDELPPPMEA
jgi:hypothetical protein